MRYTPSHQGLRQYLLHDPQLGQALEHAAQDIADRARAIAPRDSGEYASMIGTEPGPVIKIGRNFRQTVNVVANAPHSAALEFGYARRTRQGLVDVPGQRILLRAAQSA